MRDDQTRSEIDSLRHHMAARFSCRGFRPDPVPDEVIVDILDIARWAASWNNLQLWDDVVVTRPETTRALSAELLAAAKEPFDTDFPYPEGYHGVYLDRRREVGFGLYKAVGIERNDYAARERQGLENFRFFGAPHVALITIPAEQGVYGVLDAGGFVTAFMLAAETHGLASIAQAALAQRSGLIKRRFGVAEDRKFVCGISFGYADMEHPANAFRARREPAEKIFRFA
jgi:nitroreductase